MKKTTPCRAALLLLCAALLGASLCSCSLILDGVVDVFNEETATIAVEGNLDILYHGQVNEDYLDLLDDTEENLRADYTDGLKISAEYFAYYWAIVGDYESFALLDASLQTRMIDLIENITQKTVYAVQPAQTQSNGYSVQVLIRPVNIMLTASEIYDTRSYEPLAEILAEAEKTDWEQATDADYLAFCNRYGNIIVDMFDTLLPELGYMEEKSIVIQVEEDADGYLQLNSDDLANFDRQIIPYDLE